MKKLICTLIVALPLISFSQSSDFGNWIIYFGNKQFNSKWNLHHEVQYRNYNAIGDLEQLLLRTGVGYNLTESNNNVLLGYGFILSENYLTDDIKAQTQEHRIYQQFITKQRFGRISFQHRYRIEERFIEDIFRMRFRYFLSTNIALNHKEMVDKTLYLSGYNEIFLNTTGTIFSRNRIYGGLGFKVNKSVRFELGYMTQRFEGGGRDQLNVIAFVSF